ncbi:MAG: hypothetical protein WCA29_01580 [Jiangellales bacterium]
MRRQVGVALGAAALAVAGAIPAAAAMGQGPGHDLPNTPGVNVLAHADAADYSLAFTVHTSKSGDAHGSIDFVHGDVSLTKLDLSRLAFMDEAAAASGGCTHGAMIIARGTALYNGTEQVKIWVDLQDRHEGDRVRIRAMALKDHDGHDDGGDDHGTAPGGPGGMRGGTSGGGHEDGTDGHTGGHDEGTDSHEDGTDGHDGCSDGGSPWLYRSHWFDVPDVDVHLKGYMKK